MNLTRLFATIALVLMVLIAPAQAATPGDVTGDDQVDVSDIQCTVLTSLNPQTPDCLAQEGAADLNCDATTDVVDIQLMVLIVLAHPQPGIPEDKDANGNNIHDDCEGQAPECGNGQCEQGEDCSSCPEDCGQCGNYIPGDIIITEFMKDPKMIPDVQGEWFEIRNMTVQNIDLNGWKIEDADGESHTINNGGPLTLGASSIMVIGNNGNPASACGVSNSYVWSGFTLANGDDEIRLVAPDGTVVDEVAYDDNTFPDIAGRSISLATGSMNHTSNDNGSNWCVGTIMMSCGDWGTPAMMNPSCPPPAVCGNGQVEAGEQCDDSNTQPGDGCDEDCQLEGIAVCGNGQVEIGESCDDGNTQPGDGCDENCQKETAVCGNGELEGDEECDDGNWTPGDGCDEFCMLEAICGNGITEPGEQCDPPDPPLCLSNCMLGYTDPLCGDGYKHEDEMCDDGCMQGIPNVCEQGVDDGDGCNFECELEGDVWVCGNGIVDPDEMCDDGNTQPGDGCDEDCMLEIPEPACSPSPCCGDLNVDLGENCDDGNMEDGDGCSSDCQIEMEPVCSPSPCCGDSSIDAGESCDDGNLDDGDGCDSQCQKEDAICGNGQVEMGEQCDDGNTQPGDGCDGDCQFESANGVITGTISYNGSAGGGDGLKIFVSQEAPPDFGGIVPPLEVTGANYPYPYTFSGLPAGDFYVVAYFDKNNDSKGPGDLKSGDVLGAYPSYNNPATVTVVDDQTTPNINFTLTSPY